MYVCIYISRQMCEKKNGARTQRSRIPLLCVCTCERAECGSSKKITKYLTLSLSLSLSLSHTHTHTHTYTQTHTNTQYTNVPQTDTQGDAGSMLPRGQQHESKEWKRRRKRTWKSRGTHPKCQGALALEDIKTKFSKVSALVHLL